MPFILMLLPISEVTEEKNSHEFESRGNLVGLSFPAFVKLLWENVFLWWTHRRWMIAAARRSCHKLTLFIYQIVNWNKWIRISQLSTIPTFKAKDSSHCLKITRNVAVEFFKNLYVIYSIYESKRKMLGNAWQTLFRQ